MLHYFVFYVCQGFLFNQVYKILHMKTWKAVYSVTSYAGVPLWFIFCVLGSSGIKPLYGIPISSKRPVNIARVSATHKHPGSELRNLLL